MTYYNTGTIDLNNGSKHVAGYGTSFGSFVRAGDVLDLGPAAKYAIKSVNSNTSLTLFHAYEGESETGIDYLIVLNAIGRDSTSELARGVAELLAEQRSKAATINEYVELLRNTNLELEREFYVDSVLGDDNAVGNSSAPLLTIARAMELTPAHGSVEVTLLEDYNFSVQVDVSNRVIQLRGEQGSKPQLTFDRFLHSGTLRGCRGVSMRGTTALVCENLSIQVPSSAGGYEELEKSSYASPFRAARFAGIRQALTFEECDIHFSDEPLGGLINHFGCTELNVAGNSFPDYSYRGRMLQQYTDLAGTVVNTIPELQSNLDYI
ncbi:hypothetical protein [Flexibacterium corallicola]|uniref:hypothetical protein n=1 Tax=Flexibacterium corallicola TaxID=3037259 RepID=UPI00286F7B96|nr:hypothetical protein [Pseudovibrio sp. M1P-2-3]